MALAIAKKEAPDLILLDLGLPGGDGFVVLDRMKNIASLACTPVIVVSARDPKANEQRALAAGAEAFFQKPVDNDELMKAIQRALMR
jgi:CheY-like chemotaxis protein